MSITELSTRVAWIAALAILALLLAGRRKPARAWRRPPRDPRRAAPLVPVKHAPTTLHRQAGVLRRLLGLVGLGTFAVTTGALVALAVSVTVAWAVTTLTGMLS